MSEHSHPVDKGKEGADSEKNYTIQQQARNYFKSVSENKEIAKLASLLSTSINSNKKVSAAQINKYIHLWICIAPVQSTRAALV
jgi:hypothetical protein